MVNMKKIGIITLYFNNFNYGGLLQSYALCEFIRKEGNESYQISFNRTGKNKAKKSKMQRFFELFEELSFQEAVKKIFSRIEAKVLTMKVPNSMKKKINEEVQVRQKIMSDFINIIPHTKIVDEESISDLSEEFDTYITGSDQVWKPGVYCDEYFLNFTNKNKISYAASISRSKLTKHDKRIITDSVKLLNAVSVREFEAVEFLNKQGISAQMVVDPTLLLTREEWALFSEPYDIKEKYLFCYFLGNSKKQRERAIKYAMNHGLKIVTLPYLSGCVTINDIHFGDYRLFDVTPRQFVYLIKNAQYVFTDSFHVVIFSSIFGKRFVVFEREEEKTMNGRIINLLELFGAKNRFVKDIDNIDDLSGYKDIYRNKSFMRLRKQSIEYLINNCL